MSPENRRRVAYSIAALAVVAIWRPLRAAVASDALFFILSLAAIVLAGVLANRLSR